MTDREEQMRTTAADAVSKAAERLGVEPTDLAIWLAEDERLGRVLDVLVDPVPLTADQPDRQHELQAFLVFLEQQIEGRHRLRKVAWKAPPRPGAG